MAEDKDEAERHPGEAPPPSTKPATHEIDNDLPVIESPKLDASETPDEPILESIREPIVPLSPPPAPARSFRFALLAATLAIAASVGSFAGSYSATRVAHVPPPPVAKPSAAELSVAQALKSELAELTALKASLDSVTRSTSGQFAKLAERLDRAERPAQAESGSKLAQIAEAVDRLEKRGGNAAAAPETTGSITPAAAPPSTTIAAASAEAKMSERILQDWVVEDVRGSHALVESRYGGLYTVTSGSTLPGLGHVQAIKRKDGHWIVVTERGSITSDK